MKKVKIGVFGAGGHSSGMVKILCDLEKNVEVKAVYDPDVQCMKDFKTITGQRNAKCCKSYQEFLSDPEITWTMVMSPNSFHKEQVVASFESGKHVFSEKPLATTIKDCQEIYDAHKKFKRLFATGFVLRYAPMYRKVKELLDSGEFGRVIAIDANENISPAHGGYIMSNWRRLSRFAGSHLLEKCCHDLDLINWFAGSLPSKVASFGGNDFFIPKNAWRRDEIKKRTGKDIFHTWFDELTHLYLPHKEPCPFKSDKDILDNQVSILQYRNNVRVQFQCTMCNAIPERRKSMTCENGNIITEEYANTIRAKKLGVDEPELCFSFPQGDHGCADPIIMRSLADSMLTGTVPMCGGDEGLEGSVTAIAIDEACAKGKVIDLEPIWKKLGR